MSTATRTRAVGLVIGAAVALVVGLVVVLAMRTDTAPDQLATDTTDATGAPSAPAATDPQSEPAADPDSKNRSKELTDDPQDREKKPRAKAEKQATEPVPAARTTDVGDRIRVRPQQLLDPVPADETVTVDDRVQVRIRSLRLTKAEAHGPGEVAGRALAVTVRLTSSAKRPFSLDSATVTAFDAADAPLATLTTPRAADPFEGRLPVGGHKDATYLFQFPKQHPTPITVTVSPAPGLPVAVLVGDPA